MLAMLGIQRFTSFNNVVCVYMFWLSVPSFQRDTDPASKSHACQQLTSLLQKTKGVSI